MIQTVRLDKKENYLIDKSTGNVLDRYNPDNKSLELVIKLDDSMLKVDAENIKMEYGGQIVVLHNEDKFLIDDGYQNVLIKAGYIVFKDYDERYEYDKSNGNYIRADIVNFVRDKIEEFAYQKNSLIDMKIDNLYTEINVNIDNYLYSFCLDTVDNMVNKNKKRKDNSLAYYPFDKKMDKFGTLYVSVFAKKIGQKILDPVEKYKVSGNIISEFISQLGADFHYVSQDIKRRVLKWNGI